MTTETAPWGSYAAPAATVSAMIGVRIDGHVHAADLAIPAGATGIVVFAHGEASGRHCARNGFVAERLRRAGIATLLPDLLTDQERHADAATGVHRFDIPFLASRLLAMTDVLAARRETRDLRVGVFGAGVGAAAALAAAALRPDGVGAIVARGGRPDLAGPLLGRVAAPTLLIVGGGDAETLEANRGAARGFTCPARVEVVPWAGAGFDEPGALERVSWLTRGWFDLHLARRLVLDARAP